MRSATHAHITGTEPTSTTRRTLLGRMGIGGLIAGTGGAAVAVVPSKAAAEDPWVALERRLIAAENYRQAMNDEIERLTFCKPKAKKAAIQAAVAAHKAAMDALEAVEKEMANTPIEGPAGVAVALRYIQEGLDTGQTGMEEDFAARVLAWAACQTGQDEMVTLAARFEMGHRA